MTDQGLGEVSEANEAGNPVLGDGQSHRVCLDGKPGVSELLYSLTPGVSATAGSGDDGGAYTVSGRLQTFVRHCCAAGVCIE